MPVSGVAVTQTEADAVVWLSREFDVASAPQLREQLLGLVEGGILAVTVDLAQLDFIDSTGLSVLVAGLKYLRERGGDLTVRSPSPKRPRRCSGSPV